MSTRIPCVAFAVVTLVAGLQIHATAQGGWRQWDIYFRDGTRIEANPLQLRKDGRFTRSMDPKEPGFERSKISYFAATRKGLPPLPTETPDQDMVVMLDGSSTTGAITFREVKFSEGKIVQNGKEMTLENVAYIRFGAPKKKKPVGKKKN